MWSEIENHRYNEAPESLQRGFKSPKSTWRHRSVMEAALLTALLKDSSFLGVPTSTHSVDVLFSL